MLTLIKKIYTISVLLKNLIFHKKHYILSFKADRDSAVKRWYYDFPHWGFLKGNLEMVSGADGLCEMYSGGKDKLTIEIIASKKMLPLDIKTQYDLYVGEPLQGTWKDKITLGRNYNHPFTDKDGNQHITTMWICPVTLFVLGRYPNYIYVKKA